MNATARSIILSFTILLHGGDCLPIGDRVYRLNPFPVSSPMEAFNDSMPGLNAHPIVMKAGGAENPAMQLQNLPGLSFASRGPNSMEPVLRGRGADRVRVTFNGLIIPDASPTGTSSAINNLAAHGLHAVQVQPSLPSVTTGPTGTGGSIQISAISLQAPGRQLWISGASGDNAINAGMTSVSRTRYGMLAFALNHRVSADYRSGEGDRVDADYRGWTISATGQYSRNGQSTWYWAGQYNRQELARNPSLPLDTVDSDSWILTLAHTIDTVDGQWRFEGGYARARPRLSAEDRVINAAAPLQSIEAKSKVDSVMLATRHVHFAQEDIAWEAGVEFHYITRDTWRTRILNSGIQFHDHIWPDVRELIPGAYIEARGGSAGSFNWRTGLRLDYHMTHARALNDSVQGIPGAKANTIGGNFIAYNGPSAASDRLETWSGMANFVLEMPIHESTSVELEGGYKHANPSVGQRYRAFLNALGGGAELGNPALREEQTLEASASINTRLRQLQFTASFFVADCRDYVVRQIISHEPLVYGFRNANVRIHGWESAAVMPLYEGPHWDLNFRAAHTRSFGTNQITRRDLAEIAPWDATATVILSFQQKHGLASTFVQVRTTGAMTNPTPDLVPIYRDSRQFTLVDWGMDLHLSANVMLAMRISNISDQRAYAYLQPPVDNGPVGPSSGDLKGGDRIPLPGRSFSLRITGKF